MAADGSHPADFAASAQAESHYMRMCRLGRLDAGELRRLLGGDPASAAPWIEAAALYGVTEAQVRLGQMRLDGLGVPRDEALALDLFLRAARAGSPEAMNMAGRCYENGWGAPESLAAAAEWYRRSAEGGHDWGQYNHANMLFDGRGVARDLEGAVRGYALAAEQGHTRAMNLLARCHEEGWGTPRSPERARHWYRRSAEGGYFRAQFNYGTLLAAAGRIGDAAHWFDSAIRAATPASAEVMIAALLGQGDPRLADIGRRFAEAPGA